MAAILVSARLTGSSSAQCRSLRDSRSHVGPSPRQLARILSLADVRRPRGQPQAAVLPNSPRPAGGPPRCGPEARRVGDPWSSSSRRAFALAGRPRPRCRSPGVRSRRPHPRIPVRGFVAAEPAPRPARPSRRVRRTASARLSPLGARPSRPLLTQRSFVCRPHLLHLVAADSRGAAAYAACGPEAPTVAREERRDRLSPRCSRLRTRILPRGMSCHVR